MRIAVMAVAAASVLVSAAPAFAAEQPAPAPAAAPTGKDKGKKDEDPNRMVCVREHVVGSNRPQKVCMTAAERQRIKDDSARALDESRRPGTQNPGSMPVG